MEYVSSRGSAEQENSTPTEEGELSRLQQLAANETDEDIARLLLEQSSLSEPMSEKDQLEVRFTAAFKCALSCRRLTVCHAVVRSRERLPCAIERI
jgi:mannitol-1-phosphate/altronate dehydrogenase